MMLTPAANRNPVIPAQAAIQCLCDGATSAENALGPRLRGDNELCLEFAQVSTGQA
jgi:hypothetical protein